MRLLGFIKVDNKKIILLIDLSQGEQAFEETIRTHLQERLKRNRLIWSILKELADKRELKLNETAKLLESACPYILASEKTWLAYARSFAKWMDIADLAIYNNKDGLLSRYTLGETEVRDFRRFTARQHSETTIPPIQYKSIEEVAIRLIHAMKQRERIDWSGLSKSAITKSLIALEELNFIQRKPGYITLLKVISDFVNTPEERPSIFAQAALENIESFKIFLEILEKYRNERLNLHDLGIQLKKRLKADWKNSTASINAKILLNWARYANRTPGVWKQKRKRGKTTNQPSLFSNL